MVSFVISSAFGRQSLDAVRIGPNLDQRPPTSIIPGHESRRWRGGAATPRRSAQALTQRKEYDSVINERDILGAQLIRRNDEIGLLHEKLKIQRSTLTRGEEQYSARVHDVQVLRLKIRDMQREVAVASGGAQLSDDLRRDLLQCRRDLLEEKAK